MDLLFDRVYAAGADMGRITLNRPQNLNALNLDMCKEIRRCLAECNFKEAIKAIIIESSSEKAFCAGGDVRAVYEWMRAGKQDQAINFFHNEYRMNLVLFDLDKPCIAFLDGITMGGGVGISIHGSHSVATERLVWAMPETKIGFFPDVGVGYYLARMPDNMGIYLALTGEKLLADDAFHLGIVQGVVASDRLEALKKEIADSNFQSSDFEAVNKIIARFHKPAEKYNLTQESYEKIKKYFSGNSVEEIIKNLEQGSDEWSQSILKKLAEQSPLSLKITFEHLRRCRHLNFDQVIKENYLLARRFVYNENFLEGIRAAIIDKDHNPQWYPKTLEEISSSEVNNFFMESEEKF